MIYEEKNRLDEIPSFDDVVKYKLEILTISFFQLWNFH